ncbi:helix-turn-helix domain-containing protein [Candidatus Shapirobacteria bacterium]|nr:helix-turn-helix domain-containing protein [Candidatus Shapirobacteria bacterium]
MKKEKEPKKIDAQIKNWIWKLREEEKDCRAQKIRKFLIDRYGVSLSPTTIYKVLSKRYKLRSKWKKNKIRGSAPCQSSREVIQMDSVDFGGIFAFTGIDIYTKEAEAKLFPSLRALDGLDFLEYSFKNRKYTDLLQTDGGPEFKAESKQNVFRVCK